MNWEALEERIGESETAYQRPVIRRKIDELVADFRDCKDAGTLPAIPGAVIITSEKRFTFTPMASQHDLGLLQIPEEHGVLRVLDGQHRLLALHALTQAGENLGIEVPAVLFDRLDARQIVELFVTINAKHTRLNPSHIVSLAGAQALPGSQPGPGPRRDPLAGLLRASRRRCSCSGRWPPSPGWRWRRPALFGLLVRVGRELSPYAVEKMLYVLAPLLAVLGAALLVEVLGSAYAPLGRRLQVGSITAGLVVLALCLVQVAPRLVRPVDDRVPPAALTADLVAAAAWLRDNAPDEAPLYLTPDHLPAYWVEIGLLKRDRTAAALPGFHDRVRPPGHYWAWPAAPGAPNLALLTRDADRLIGPEVEPLVRAGGAAVVARRRDAGGEPLPTGGSAASSS